MMAVKSPDLIEGIIECGNTCSWTAMEIAINMQMVETSLPINEPLRHIIPAVKKFFLFVLRNHLCSAVDRAITLFIFKTIFVYIYKGEILCSGQVFVFGRSLLLYVITILASDYCYII